MAKVNLDEFLSMFVDGKGYIDGKQIKKIYLGKENFTPRSLPSGYTQLEYIESSGTQYIDTEFKPNQDTRVVCKGQFLDISSTVNMFGTRVSTSSGRYELLVSGNYIFSSYNTAAGSSISSTTDILLIDKNKNVTSNNGETFDTSTYAAFQTDYNLLLFAGNRAGTVGGKATCRIYFCQIYDNGTLVRDFVPCKNSSGTAGLYDLANEQFYTNAGTGTFVTGNEYKCTAQKQRKIYTGNENGIAQLVYAGTQKLSYYGTATALSVGRAELAATTVGNYALFGGGSTSTFVNTVDAYDTSLTRTIPTALSVVRDVLAATTIGDYALFGGGSSGDSYASTVDAYNKSLTRSTPTALSLARINLAATTIGDYALFGGGYLPTSGSYATVDAYNKSLTRTIPTALSVARDFLAATTIGDYALFGGGCRIFANTANAEVDAYNKSLTRSTPTALSQARSNLAATTVGSYALFGGGGVSHNYSNKYAVVDAYNAALTRTIPTALSAERYALAATTVGDYALFGGGGNVKGRISDNTVDAYDASLTRTIPTALSVARYQLAAATIGDYALFAGGYKKRTEVNVYTVS